MKHLEANVNYALAFNKTIVHSFREVFVAYFARVCFMVDLHVKLK